MASGDKAKAAVLLGFLLSLGGACMPASDAGPSVSGSGGAAGTGSGSGGSASGSGGSVAGTGGTSGTMGSGGAPGQGSGGDGGTVTTDGPPASDGDAGSLPIVDAPTTNSDAALAPLQECTTPSIDRIQYFGASGEGTTVPMNGTLLVKEGNRYVAKQQYLKSEWHVTEVLIGNTFNTQVDLTTSKGITLTWSATADLWIQMRPGFHYSGGAQWVTKLPSTGGQVKTQFFSLDPAQWSTDLLGKPAWSYAMARAAVRGLVFVGNMPNVITISGLRIDGYTPMCR
jgi:hypothetical protein